LEDIYKLKLHESCCLENMDREEIKITRVPGGWIYNYTEVSSPVSVASPVAKSVVFVPFNNEFQLGE